MKPEILCLLVLLLASGARAQTPTALPPLPGDFRSEATGINTRGEVAGFSRGSAFTAVVWDVNGTPTALPPLAGSTRSFGNAINDSGEVAGQSAGGGSVTAVVWDRDGTPPA